MTANRAQYADPQIVNAVPSASQPHQPAPPIPATGLPLVIPQPHTMDLSQSFLDWIGEQARTGVVGLTLHHVLTQNGWAPDVAGKAITQAMQMLHPGYVLNPDVANVHHGAIPEPLLYTGDAFIDAGDRVVEVVMTSMLPRVIVFDNFMSDEECDGLIEQARPRMERSSVVQPMTGASMVNDIRTSTGMFFKAAESELVARIEKRIERLVHWPVENGEAIQVLNYQQGAEYQPHQDYFDPSDPGTPNSLGLSGQRVGTVLMYLNTPVRGGGTMFPEAGIEVKAKKGRAVLFSYSRPSPAMRTLHGGMPVLEGEKWAATKWLRQRPFQPLGVPQPPKATF